MFVFVVEGEFCADVSMRLVSTDIFSVIFFNKILSKNESLFSPMTNIKCYCL